MPWEFVFEARFEATRGTCHHWLIWFCMYLARFASETEAESEVGKVLAGHHGCSPIVSGGWRSVCELMRKGETSPR